MIASVELHMNTLLAQYVMYTLAEQQYCCTLKDLTENLKILHFCQMVKKIYATNLVCYIIQLKWLMIDYRPFRL